MPKLSKRVTVMLATLSLLFGGVCVRHRVD
jgi:hypothetical protein